MRHKDHSHSFGRKPSARKALLRGLVMNLVEHGRIHTTLAKAKELRRHVERAITMGKKGTLHARRILLSRFPNQETVSTIVGGLSVRFMERPGGYTRILKTGVRSGDNAEMALIEFVDYQLPDSSLPKPVLTTNQKSSSKEKADKKKRIRKIQAHSRRMNRNS